MPFNSYYYIIFFLPIVAVYLILRKTSSVSVGKAWLVLASLDNGFDNLWEVQVGKYWHWDAVNYRNRVDPVKFVLFEGKHTIKVKLREDGTKLDKLLLTNDISFIPRGEGGSAENQGLFEGN
jgi:hypothetical protein